MIRVFDIMSQPPGDFMRVLIDDPHAEALDDGQIVVSY